LRKTTGFGYNVGVSQYPYPYNVPDPYHYGRGGGDDEQRARYRRAGVLLLVLGGLMLLPGFCCVGIPLGQSTEQWNALVAQVQEAQPASQIALEPVLLRQVLITMGVVSMIAGLAYLVLGALVMRGSAAATVIALIVNGLLIAVLLLLILLALLAVARGSVAEVLGVCMYSLPLALLIWSAIWLAQARSGGAGPPGSYPPYWQPLPPQGPGGYPPPPP
jgi:uncharacterized membrane protein